MLNLDTHVLLYAVTGNLKPRKARLLGSRPWMPLLTGDRALLASRVVPLAH